MSIVISIKANPREVQRQLRRTDSNIQGAIRTAIRKSAFLIEREAKKVTPVDTGTLRRSIFSDIMGKKATVQPFTDYAFFVHEGTRFMKGRPYMEKGAENAERDIKRIFEKEIDRAIG